MVASLLAPPACWSCRAPPPRGRPLCGRCRQALRFLPPEPVALSGVRVWAPLAYEGPARDLVRALKFNRALGVASEMAAMMVASAPGELLRATTLVPVPLAAARLRKRGFNQAALLAEAIAKRRADATSGGGAGSRDPPVAECLRRRGGGPPQVGRGRHARLGGPVGTIVARGRVPSRALIVDDVVTTAGTVAACAAALREAGADEVAAIVFARTLGR
jgi:predicted amidophosphoribosyltransferase